MNVNDAMSKETHLKKVTYKIPVYGDLVVPFEMTIPVKGKRLQKDTMDITRGRRLRHWINVSIF